MENHKPFVYHKGNDPLLDRDFEAAEIYNKVKVGKTAIFWRYGLRRYAMPVENIQRIFRRVEPVFGRLCCGGRSYIIEWLVLVLHDGSEIVLHIGDDVQKQAEALLVHLKSTHPQLQYGKV